MMRRSSSMGGGARMFRSMSRAVATGVKGKLPVVRNPGGGKGVRVVDVTPPRTTAVTPLTLSVIKASGDRFCEDDDWENVVANDGDDRGFGDRWAFGPVPTKEEAEEAITTIQRIFVPITFSRFSEVEYFSFEDEKALERVALSADLMEDDCSTESESDWIEPVMHLYSSKASNNPERENVLNAFLMLQTNRPFKRMVTSLSSDPAVWDAVMKNEVVQELKASFYEAESSGSSSKDEEHAEGILRWILKSTKGKIMEFIDKISKLANELFRLQEKDEDEVADAFDGLLGASVILSIVVFMIVVISRIQNT